MSGPEVIEKMESGNTQNEPGVVRVARAGSFPGRGGAWVPSAQVAGFLLICLAAGLMGSTGYGAQTNKGEPVYLVARRQIHGPFFRQSVVMLLPARNQQLIMGLIINKPTRITLRKLFPDVPGLQKRSEPAYFGGPVDMRFPSAAFHSAKAPAKSLRLYGDVYLTFDAKAISDAFQASQSTSVARLFLGRAQWAPGQLQNEIRQGAWYRIHAEGNLIFSSNPQGLWQKLHDGAAPRKYIRYLQPAPEHPAKTRLSRNGDLL